MAYENGATYWICPVDNTGVALSVRGDSQVSQNRDVFLYTKEDIGDQLWRVDVGNGFARIKSTLDDRYALNIYLSTGNCDIHTWADNLEDSKINFRTINANDNLYQIQNYRNNADNNLYLTASKAASGGLVTWNASNGSSLQKWKLIKKTGGGTGTVHEISGLTNYNYNQKAGPSEGFRAAGCACACGMDVTSFYTGKRYSFEDFRSYYDDYSGAVPPHIVYKWGTPAGFKFVEDGEPNGKNEADTIAYIKRYIDQGIPPICHCLPVNQNESEHWVVPFKYVSGSGWDSIWVLDPYLGVERTMAEAMRLSCGGTSGGVDRIMRREYYDLK